jgi:starch synthase
MKVYYVTSEAAPFSKTGGLGDVMGSLPIAMRKKNVGVRVVTPLYESIPNELRSNMKFIKNIWVDLSWRHQYCGVFEAKYNGVTYFLIDNEYYFKRPEIYGYFDDGERFAFLSKAAVDLISQIDFEPDIVHANDWQTALVPVYLKLCYQNKKWAKRIKTVFTIHNIGYQGQFSKDIISDVFGIDPCNYYNGIMEHDGCVNLMKAAIQISDYVTTVSPTYAKEIQTPIFGNGLDTLLLANSSKLEGILNAIDTEEYNPTTDKAIFKNYDAEHPADKHYNKVALQKMMGLEQNEKIPMIAMISRLVSHKGLDLVCGVLEELLKEKIQFVVVGKGDWMYEQTMVEVQRKYPGKVSANIAFNSDLAKKVYAGADMLLMPSYSEPCGLSQLIALRYGTIPIVRETGGLYDTVQPFYEPTGEGNGFSFSRYEGSDMLYVIRQAIGIYQKRNVWEKLVVKALEGQYGWEVSAKNYLAVYRRIAAPK